MFSVPDSTNVYLVPAGSPEDQKILQLTVQGGGLTQSDISAHTSSETNTGEDEIQNKLSTEVERRGQIEDKLTRLRSRQRELQSQNETADKSNADTHDAYQESSPAEEWVDEDEIATKIDELEVDLEAVDQTVAALRTEGNSVAGSETSVAIETVEKATDELADLRTLVETPDDEGVLCWPVESSTIDQYQLSAGDLLLFYRGNRVYRFAAKVGGKKTCNALWDLLSPDQHETRRSQFVVFSTVIRIQVDSSVIADIAGHDLDYPISFTRLNESSKHELQESFGEFESFLEQAQKEGINTRPQESTSDQLDKWLSDPSPTTSTTISSTTPSQTDSTTQPTTENVGTNDPDSTVSTTTTDAGARSQTSSPRQKPETDIEEIGSRSEWEILRDQLQKHKLLQIVGPQKTGKRQLIDELVANWFTETGRIDVSNRVRYANFHPDISYGEFVLGNYGEHNTEQVNLVTGPLGKFVDLAAADTQQFVPRDDKPTPKYLFVIENFQMAKPATVFGELWQALRPQNRGSSHPVSVTGTSAELWVPDDFYIIGVVDSNRTPPQQSSYQTDSLFATYQTEVNTESLRHTYDVTTTDSSDDSGNYCFGVESVLALEQLNKKICQSSQLGPQYALGQFFLSEQPDEIVQMDEASLCEAWQYDIFSTLARYRTDGLTTVGPLLLEEYLKPDDTPVTLGRIHSDAELTQELVSSLAQDHEGVAQSSQPDVEGG